jgi:flavodoxin short chain
MASLIRDGAEAAGASVTLKHAADASPGEVADYGAAAFGSPATNSESIEESEMAPFMKSAVPFLAGKRVALFGSYGWGDGEWMRRWTDELERAGISPALDCLMIREAPEGAGAEECVEWGRKLAELK